MRPLICKLKRVCIFITIMAFVSFMCGGVFCGEDNHTERTLENASKVMAPGWINIDTQRSQSFREKKVKKKASSEEKAQEISAEFDRSMLETEPDKVKAELKKKAAAGKDSDKVMQAQNALNPKGVKNQTYKPKGTLVGTERDSRGRIVAQTYFYGGEETRHVIVSNDTTNYALDTIKKGVNAAKAGDTVLVKSGEYVGDCMVSMTDIKLIGENPYTTIITPPTKRKSGYYSGWRTIEFYSPHNITVKNFTILAGKGTYDGGACLGYQGVYFTGRGENVLFENNIVKNAFHYGVTIWGYVDNVRIINNTVTGSAYGVSLWQRSDDKYTLVQNNIISDNRSLGILIGTHSHGESTDIIGNVISGSGMGGIWTYSEFDGFEGAFWGNYFYNNAIDVKHWQDPDYAIGSDNYARPWGPLNATLAPRSNQPDTLGGMHSPTYWRNISNYNKFGQYGFDSTLSLSLGKGLTTPLREKELGAMFKGLLANKDLLVLGKKGELDPAVVAKLLQETLRESALSIPVGEMGKEQMEIAMILASILNNPTVEQKLIIDALQSIINEAEKLEEEAGSDPGFKKASDDFAQMVATVLLAQALPDLLKEGDMSSIKGIFGELDREKSHILLEYQASVKAYYTNIVKELAVNMTTLQIKDLIAKNLTERELEKLPTQRIDEILDKIRDAKDKTITEEEILKKEQEYKEEYLIPAKRTLEENMKTLLEGFTQKLTSVLDGAGLV